MHELAICQALITQVTDLADERSATSVSDIFVSVGPLSGVESALLENAFPIAAAGTVAAGAELHIDSLPVIVHCKDCDAESKVSANRLLCAQCGTWKTRLVSGDELLLTRVELEIDEHTGHRDLSRAGELAAEG
ncbi:MAG: hydrogenase nickel incorporation protein HypA [Gammaproteobacteria bacterium]|nr:MAG: hydrogenase nickel incorporation protein HypA [Gammaproteobacteria bacterium]